MAKKTYPVLWDLDRCITGSFVAMKDTSDIKYCKVFYYPVSDHDNFFKVCFRAFFPKKPIEYFQPVPKDSIKRYTVPMLDKADIGQLSEVVVIMESKDGKAEMLDTLFLGITKKLKEMRDKVESVSTEAKISQQQNKELKDAKQRQEALEKQKPNTPPPTDAFGRPLYPNNSTYPYGGMPPSFP